MAWQDWVLAFAGIILGASLIPTIRGDDKPALSTAMLTTVIIAVVCVTMATMGLWLSAATNILIVGAWGLISWQKFHQIRRARHSVILELEEEIVHGVHDPPEHQPLDDREDAVLPARR